MGDVAQIEVRAAVDQFRADMAAAGKSFADVMKQMGSANAPLDQATKATEHAHDSLLGKLREFKGEQVQQGKMARFYAGELMSIVPAGKEAKDAIQGLLGIFIEGAAGGLSLGLAFEAVKFGIEMVRASSERAKKELEDFGKKAEESLKAAATWAKAAADEFLRVQGKDPSFLEKSKELLDTQRQISALEKQSKTSSIGGLTEAEIAKLEILRKKYAELSEQIKKYQESKRGTTEIQTAKAAAEEESKAAQVAADARAKLEEQFRQKDIAATKWVEDEKRKGMEDAAKRAEAILKAQAAEEEKIARDEARIAWEIAQSTPRREATLEELHPEMVKQRVEEAKKSARDLAQIGEEVGSAFGDAFGGMITGTKSVGAAFAKMGADILKVILQVAIKSITASAMKAGGEAASSQAGIPIVGPALAVGAMTAMIGVVMGLIGSLTSSRGGYEVPGNVSAALGVLHPNETVLPADLSMGLKDMIRGGGGGSGVTFNISAVDGRSVYRLLMDEQSDVWRALRDIGRGR